MRCDGDNDLRIVRYLEGRDLGLSEASILVFVLCKSMIIPRPHINCRSEIIINTMEQSPSRKEEMTNFKIFSDDHSHISYKKAVF
jgi:hypothetical protein